MTRTFFIIGIILALMLGVAAAAGCPRRFAALRQRSLNLWEKLVLGANLFSIAGLALTGFWATLVQHHPLAGYQLMLHTSLGGLFFTSLAALAVTFAEACRIEDADWSGAPQGRLTLAPKLAFWGLLLFGLGATLTVLLSMLPLTGVIGLGLFYQAHRLCALAVAMIAIGFGVFLRLRPAGLVRPAVAQDRQPAPAAKAGV